MKPEGKDSSKAARRGWLGLAAFFALTVSLAGSGCVEGTEVQDPYELAGRVVHENGEPAEGAIVIAGLSPQARTASAKSTAASSAAAYGNFDTVFTDASGRYHFDSLPFGRYDLSIEDSTPGSETRKRSRLPDLPATKASILAPDAILMPPGELIGSLVDRDHDTPLDGGYCTVEGTPYHDLTKSGIFHFSLATGIYSIRCSRSPYNSTYTVVEVNANTDKIIRIPMDVGPSPEIRPVPSNVRAEYNPATGVVTLTWSSANFPQWYMYGIKRVDSALAGGAEPMLTKDTVFRDVVYAGQSDTVSRKALLYSIYCLKSDLNFSTGSAPIQIEATRPTSHGADLTLTFLGPKGPFTVGDTARLVGTFGNVFRDNKRLQWHRRDSADSLREVMLSGPAGSDTLIYPCESEGKLDIGMTVTDVNGTVTSLFQSLEILPSP